MCLAAMAPSQAAKKHLGSFSSASSAWDDFLSAAGVVEETASLTKFETCAELCVLNGCYV